MGIDIFAVFFFDFAVSVLYFAVAGTSSLTNVRYKNTSVGTEEMKLTRAFVAMMN